MKKLNAQMTTLFIMTFVYCDLLLASSSDGMPWESPLEKIARSLTGPTARIVALIVIALLGLGIAITYGEGISKKAIAVFIGLGITASAPFWIKFLGLSSGLVVL